MRQVAGLFNFKARPGVAVIASLAFVAIVVVLLVFAYAARKWTINSISCDSVRSEQEKQGAVFQVSKGTKRVVVFGDSWVAGQGLDDPSNDGWPAKVGTQLGWGTWIDAVKMTGFINGGFCADQPFKTRVRDVMAVDPEIVVVAGGINDADHSGMDIKRAALALLADLVGVKQVVVVGVPAVPSKSAAQIATIDGALSEAATSAGRPFISTSDWALPYESDGLHLTGSGYTQYAELMKLAIIDLALDQTN
ncbi:SGNH/GDSL hydrolase family protein [Cryobacterium sp. 5B3]|uniref:SGNH/GDSL hydrolase family protein n=1 Tax=Cryobacterium sp. 5B3 TaxID=3048586 RepID=UPI002AB43C03|nr:SGNH/GDSL hydrolase family protein [Cryobacterium sp. 5B3]MDY7540912.1 SGNH/GDSL hydrolase family protein [Cryobacterium sp. 5B3]MEB0276407.1 SGNH/GDSL hydrolase family protein [Cryobacterium sp. 5B3]